MATALLSIIALVAIQRRTVRARENPNASMPPSGLVTSRSK
jgi:hypothetical protein